MSQHLLKLQPVFKERIWGGSKLKKRFGFDIPSKQTGECWGISAHPNGESIVENGDLQGRSLRDVWEKERALFDYEQSESFPLLVKWLDAADDLSVQVHPNDEQAKRLEKGEAYGKTECWYVCEAEPGAELIIGHYAHTKEEFAEMVEQEKWSELLKKQPVEAGDFIFIPSGTIHAIGKGILILETQQSSDTTYRVYDYDRTDQEGNKRELHIGRSLEVTTIPAATEPTEHEPIWNGENGEVERLLASDVFYVYKGETRSSLKQPVQASFLLLSIIEGSGTVTTNAEQLEVQAGDNLIITKEAMEQYELEGSFTWLMSHPA
ncbi:type I phosphomannose isomerase catalytic subunit [Salsuginibacillus kocurii]|uniref:type I phosphomannose isomerase catalytic subunit n=1 Tax=Salsuginibacillus kocurii TaxID=427078 RepID=UPI00036D2ECA|nr:type I phosphomannose isomerase catalytic subunit [Salsuginibacillus kocurii]